MNIKKHQTCRICGNPYLTEVLDLGKQYIQGAFDHPNAPSPPMRKVSNRIVRCDKNLDENACGLVQADTSISPDILYRNYWYQSGISETMTKHLGNIANTCSKILNKQYDLNVLDIAANDGTLLRAYPESFNKIGIDPSDVAKKQKDLNIINETFPSAKLSDNKFDIITSIACFYDINDPELFTKEIKKLLNKDGIWVAEFAYLPSMLENLAFDQILFEHCCHYHLEPFERLLNSSKLKLFNAEITQTNGGSIMVYVCHDDCDKYDNENYKNSIKDIRFDEFEKKIDESEPYTIFKNEINDYLKKLKNLLIEYKNQNKKVHLYGASTKMNVVLEAAGIDSDLIEYAAERSKEKYGAKTLSGIQIVSEEESKKMKPDAYICSLTTFKEEILLREKDYLDSGGSFIFLPKIEIVKND